MQAYRAGRLVCSRSSSQFSCEEAGGEFLYCIAQFETPEACNHMTALATDEINNHIALNSWKAYRHVSEITREQMSEFLRIFPSEMLAFLEPFRSGLAPRVS